MKVSLLLLTLDRYHMTRYVLENMLSKISGIEYELLILDNGSTDKRFINSNSFKTSARYSIPENIGIAAGYNRLLRDAKGDYICFLKNDILVGDNWLRDLIDYNNEIERSGLTTIHCEAEKGVFGPLLNNNDTFTNVWKCQSNLTSGICLINRPTLEKVGAFDERLSLYGKEMEQYAQRLNLLGHYNYYIPDQYSIHLGRDLNDLSEYKKMKDKEFQLAAAKYPATLADMKKSGNFKIEL